MFARVIDRLGNRDDGAAVGPLVFDFSPPAVVSLNVAPESEGAELDSHLTAQSVTLQFNDQPVSLVPNISNDTAQLVVGN